MNNFSLPVFWTYHLTWPLHWPALIFNTDMTDNRKGTRYLDFHKSCREKTVGHSSGCYISHNAAGWVSTNQCRELVQPVLVYSEAKNTQKTHKLFH